MKEEKDWLIDWLINFYEFWGLEPIYAKTSASWVNSMFILLFFE